MHSMLSIDQQIGLRLAAGRKGAGFKSVRDFALTHHFPYTTYLYYESGKRSLNPTLLYRFSNLLSINPSWLLTGEGHPCQDKKDNIKKNRILESLTELSSASNEFDKQTKVITKSDTAAEIDLSLLLLIFEKVLCVLIKNSSKLSAQEIIDCCLDTYNSIINVNSDEYTKKVMIDLSVKSLFKGLREHSELESVVF